MRFLVYYEGAGEGCDYTIGCNLSVHFLEGESVQEVIEKISSDLVREGRQETCWYSLDQLEAIRVYSISEEHVIDLDSLQMQKDAIEKEKAERQKEQEERQLYEKLKTKFG